MDAVVWQGARVLLCLNRHCQLNNNSRYYCHCEHMQLYHQRVFGVCLADNCNCDGFYFWCTEQVWNAWNPEQIINDGLSQT